MGKILIKTWVKLEQLLGKTVIIFVIIREFFKFREIFSIFRENFKNIGIISAKVDIVLQKSVKLQ